MKIAWFDCFAGAAGDMLVAAMLDAGLDPDFLKSQIATLPMDSISLEITEVKRAGLRALKFTPAFAHQHHHRNLQDIINIITGSKISDTARKTAISIFQRLADAEAAVHGKDPNEIHFHEVGAVDSIADIVSAAIGLEALDIQAVYCSPISVGGGTVTCAHGLMPVPAPATAELIKGIPINPGPAQVELLTPTAAAILTTITQQFAPLPAMKIESIGCGAGTLDSNEFPNILRLIIGEIVAPDAETADSVCLLETNIDDITGEMVGSVTEALLENGALDVFSTSIYMKQNRPAIQLSVLCAPADSEKLERLIFEKGVTFGIRKQILQRSKLARRFVTVETAFGPIAIKLGLLDGTVVNAKPEFADCAAAAKKHKTFAKAISDAALAAYRQA